MTQQNHFAVVGKPDISPPSRQRVGLPESLTGSATQALAWPRVLLVEFRSDGIFLVRYTEDGSFAGDTWHLTLEEAQHQALDEYGAQVGEWTAVPAGVEDEVAFALSRATRR